MNAVSCDPTVPLSLSGPRPSQLHHTPPYRCTHPQTLPSSPSRITPAAPPIATPCSAFRSGPLALLPHPAACTPSLFVRASAGCGSHRTPPGGVSGVGLLDRTGPGVRFGVAAAGLGLSRHRRLHPCNGLDLLRRVGTPQRDALRARGALPRLPRADQRVGAAFDRRACGRRPCRRRRLPRLRRRGGTLAPSVAAGRAH